MPKHIPLVYHPDYSFDFPESHRFPMAKFQNLYQVLSDQGYLQQAEMINPDYCQDDWLELAHCPDYISRFRKGELDPKHQRQLGLPWSEGLVHRTLLSPMGTVLTVQAALDTGIACHLAGGTHHAHYDFPYGFCIFNDLAVAARVAIEKNWAHRVLILDCDVHQGDGTARILADHPEIFTCSLHCEKNFPYRKAESDLDINLPIHMADAAYLEAVKNTLLTLLHRLEPDLVIYDAGVDVFSGDPLGLLDISLEGIATRERTVLSMCRDLEVPVATVIGGGYDADRMLLAERHALVVKSAMEIFG